MSPTTGDLLVERYRLEHVLGAGGMAQVYRARDEVLHRRVAVKVLRDSTGEVTDRARFASEARILAGLAHPGLVTVLDAGISTSAPFLVMELVEGQTLAERCSEHGLPENVVAALGTQLADAVAFAHGRHVIHRDLKPGNVLITPTGRVKLADFGIARLIGDTAGHTRTGQTIGTAAYLAPEQVRGEELTPAADVYSLGLVLLEALTGTRAYPGPATEAALARLSCPAPIPTTLSPLWRQLLSAMTSLDVDDRPSASDVSSILAGPSLGTTEGHSPTAVLTQPTIVEPPTHGSPTPARAATLDRAARRAWLALAAVAATVTVLVVLALGLTGQDAGGPAPRPVPPDVPADLERPLQELHDAVEGVR